MLCCFLCTCDIYCMSVCPGRGIPSSVSLPEVSFIFPSLFGSFSLGSKDRGCCILYRLWCKAPWGKFVILSMNRTAEQNMTARHCRHKIYIMLYWLETSNWDHKSLWDQITVLINQVRSTVTSFCINRLLQPLESHPAGPLESMSWEI